MMGVFIFDDICIYCKRLCNHGANELSICYRCRVKQKQKEQDGKVSLWEGEGGELSIDVQFD